MRRPLPVALVVAGLLAACLPARPDAGPAFQAISLLGDTLTAPELPDSVRTAREEQLAEARAAAGRDPNNPDALIWVGRRLGYLGRYREAVDAFTTGVARFPNDARFFRHRGHRYVTLRRLDLAVQDLEKAAQLVEGKPDEVEPDGQPNARNIPTSTLQSNIWYHLGLAYYLRGDFAKALRAYQAGLKVSTNPDMLVATTNWLYMTLRRLNRPAEALATLRPIKAGMDIIENGTYYRLLQLYQGRLSSDSLLRMSPAGEPSLEDVTVAYGVGNWHLVNGRSADAQPIFRAVVGARSQWAAFGYIAAEAELAREEP